MSSEGAEAEPNEVKEYTVRIEQPSLCGTTSFFFDALSKFKVHKTNSSIGGNLLKKKGAMVN